MPQEDKWVWEKAQIRSILGEPIEVTIGRNPWLAWDERDGEYSFACMYDQGDWKWVDRRIPCEYVVGTFDQLIQTISQPGFLEEQIRLHRIQEEP